MEFENLKHLVDMINAQFIMNGVTSRIEVRIIDDRDIIISMYHWYEMNKIHYKDLIKMNDVNKAFGYMMGISDYLYYCKGVEQIS